MSKSTLSAHKYLYNGKELQDDAFDLDGDGETDVNLDWYDFNFRYYDPALGRFITMDPIIEDFPSHTPYNYAFSNPTTLVDMWGLQGVDPNSYTFIRNSRAKLLTNSKEEYTKELKRFNRDDRIVTAATAATMATVSLIGGGGILLDAITSWFGGKAANSDNSTPDMEPTTPESDPNGPTTEDIIERQEPGRDGGTSKHIIEKDQDGNTVSKTHQVTKDGEVVHQHQDHVSKDKNPETGKKTTRQFPDDWVKYPKKDDKNNQNDGN